MSKTTRQYKDIAGNPCSLDWLVKNEPEWATNQIRHRDGLEEQLTAANERINELEATEKFYQDSMARIAKEICGIVSPLELTMRATDNSQTYVDLLMIVLSEKLRSAKADAFEEADKLARLIKDHADDLKAAVGILKESYLGPILTKTIAEIQLASEEQFAAVAEYEAKAARIREGREK